MIENQIVTWLITHLGALGGVLALAVLLALRFGPQVLQGLRERRLAALHSRLQRQQVADQERLSLKEEASQARAELHKILTNHISHLEAQSEATRAFHTAATEQLIESTHQLKELRREVGQVYDRLETVKDDVKELKGRP